MAFSNGPTVVTSGVVLALDAANRSSYPGSGTTWFDLSGNVNNGTLTNGPTYSTVNQGTIVFDGVDDYIVSPNQMSVVAAGGNATIEAFIYPTVLTGTQCIFNLGQDGSQFNYGMVLNLSTLRARNSNLDWSLTGTVSANTWSYVAVVFTAAGATGYINGLQVGSNASATVTTLSNNRFYTIGRRAYNNASEFFTGNIALVRTYQNIALSAAQIQQNYSSIKTRFGL